jgi:hypothetical protein
MLSLEPDASIVPHGAHDTLWTVLTWLPSAFRNNPSLKCHSVTVLPKELDASMVPHGDHDML